MAIRNNIHDGAIIIKRANRCSPHCRRLSQMIAVLGTRMPTTRVQYTYTVVRKDPRNAITTFYDIMLINVKAIVTEMKLLLYNSMKVAKIY